MNELGIYLFLAASFESISQYLWSIRKWRESIPAYIALALAIGAAFTLHLDILKSLGFTDIPYSWVTIVLTGFATGRGASFVHDVAGWVSQKYRISKTDTGALPIVAKPAVTEAIEKAELKEQ